MSKLRLDLDQIRVDSFDTSAADLAPRGTVRANVAVCACCCCCPCCCTVGDTCGGAFTCNNTDATCPTYDYTCPQTCPVSCNGGTCEGQYTCGASCDVTCDSCLISCFYTDCRCTIETDGAKVCVYAY